MTKDDELFDNYIEGINEISNLEAKVRELELKNTELHRANQFGVTFTYPNGDKEFKQVFTTAHDITNKKTGEKPISMEINFTLKELTTWLESCFQTLEKELKCT